MPYIPSSSLLPQNYIAEEILIGSILINPHLIVFVIQKINTEHFFIESHKIIYRNILNVYTKNCINSINLIYSLKENNIIHQVGGMDHLTNLIKQGQILNFSKDINFYIKEIIKIINNNYNRRLIIQYGYNIITLANSHIFSNKFLYSKASKYLHYIWNNLNNKNLDNLPELIGSLLYNLEANKNELTITKQHTYSGFKDLDVLTNGLPSGDLIVIAGRPSVGKTSFVINITYNLLQFFYKQICIFSLEMTRIQILYKLISIGSGIPVTDIRFGNINTKQWHTIQKICNELLIGKLYINDNSNISIEVIKYITEILIKENEHNGIIIIDYLQLINEKTLYFENRNQELSYITRQLKIIAQTLHIPVIILSQLNRNIDKRINKKPLLSDLKESGCVSINILIHYDHTNCINIKSIYHNIYCIQDYQYKFNSKGTNYYYIYILQNYIFTCNIGRVVLLNITKDHLLFHIQRLVKLYKLQIYDSLITINKKYKNKIDKSYPLNIKFSDYSLVYDIAKYNYTNFICQRIIVHNSIEQDADIVIMLYKNSIHDPLLDQDISYVIDITISKNRNGPTGSFGMHFTQSTTQFLSTKNNF